MKFIFLLLLFFSLGIRSYAQDGCTDPQASNFNPSAKVNDGSCSYNNMTYSPRNVKNLPATLKECSGMIYWNGMIWAHNDGGNGPWFYGIDTSNGIIQKTVGLTGASNIDWEDIAQDSSNIYMGDFGNNANGNRTNLKIYIIPKIHLQGIGDTILVTNTQYEIINFSYSDQLDFSATGSNNTRFDCEAMVFHRGRLHLFSKNWIGNFSKHYSLPALEGTYLATLHDSLDTGGYLITGADVGGNNEIVLASYNKIAACSLFLLYGFNDSDSFIKTGNVRRIGLPGVISIGQLEAICFVNGIRGFIGSEFFSVFNTPQKFGKFITDQWIIDYYKHNPVQLASAGMIRYNNETDMFEYFNGLQWINMTTN